MSADPKGLQINIMGREFRVACPEEEQAGLLEAVDYVFVRGAVDIAADHIRHDSLELIDRYRGWRLLDAVA